jgi:hypothetical protein
MVSKMGALGFDGAIDDDADADADADADVDCIVDVLDFGCFPFGGISALGPGEQKHPNEESKFKVKGTRRGSFQKS